MKRMAIWATLCLGVGLLAPASARADYDLTFTTTGSPTVGGSPVGATAEFIAHGSTLTIILTDTAATATRSQVLSGVFFDITGGLAPASAVFTTPKAVVTPGSKLFTSKSASMTSTAAAPIDITGAYLFGAHASGLGTTAGPPATTFTQAYGLSATGDSPLFPAKKFTKGGASDDYGIVGPGTNLEAQSFKNSFPLVENSVTFTITGINTGTGIANVVFPFGSAPGGTAVGSHLRVVPEPGAISSLALGGAMVVAWRRRKSRRVPA